MLHDPNFWLGAALGFVIGMMGTMVAFVRAKQTPQSAP